MWILLYSHGHPEEANSRILYWSVADIKIDMLRSSICDFIRKVVQSLTNWSTCRIFGTKFAYWHQYLSPPRILILVLTSNVPYQGWDRVSTVVEIIKYRCSKRLPTFTRLLYTHEFVISQGNATFVLIVRICTCYGDTRKLMLRVFDYSWLLDMLFNIKDHSFKVLRLSWTSLYWVKVA